MIWIGTSGFSYPEWKGSFYPEKITQAKMFAYYAERFPTVEINNTFYRMPNAEMIAGWADNAPKKFLYTLKAPQRITHVQRLKLTDDTTKVFFDRARTLGDLLGCVLVQLPPNMKKDVARLEGFLAALPEGVRVAFEFRNASWFDDAVYDALRARGAALCVADSEKLATPIVTTATFGYFRLRDEGYGPEDIARWAKEIRERQATWTETFVYFKHEDAGKGPAFAAALGEELGPLAASPAR